MAIQKAKAKAAVPANNSALEVASMNPDDFLSGGLMDDFDGEIIKARFIPWDYEGKIDHHVLGVALTIKPVDSDEPFTQTYSAGDLEQFAPSMDGVEPVDMSGDDVSQMEGVYAKRVGTKTQLNGNSNWAQFVGALLDAGFDKSRLAPRVDEMLEGVFGHFNRVPQKKRSGIQVNRAEDEQQGRRRNNDLLVITELKEKPAGATSTKAAPAKAAVPANKAAVTKAAAAKGEDSLDDKLRVIVTEAVQGSDEGLNKSKLPSFVIKALSGAEKAKGLKRVGEADFLESSDTWTYDAEDGMLYSNA